MLGAGVKLAIVFPEHKIKLGAFVVKVPFPQAVAIQPVVGGNWSAVTVEFSKPLFDISSQHHKTHFVPSKDMLNGKKSFKLNYQQPHLHTS